MAPYVVSESARRVGRLVLSCPFRKMANVPLAVVLTLAAAALLSLSLILQRFALSYPSPRIRVLCTPLPRELVWFGGLVLYGCSNGLKVFALQFGPLAALASVFTTVLVFNLVFARCLLGERLTLPKIGGALVILVGAALAAVGSCTDCKTQFSSSEIESLASAPPPGGLLYLSILLALILGCVFGICWHEAWHPLPDPTAASALSASTPSEGAAPTAMGATTATTDTMPSQLPSDGDQLASLGVMLIPIPCGEGDAPKGADPARWMARMMVLIYAGSLGLDEALADLLIKAWSGILATCAETHSCSTWVLWVSITLWLLSAFAR